MTLHCQSHGRWSRRQRHDVLVLSPNESHHFFTAFFLADVFLTDCERLFTARFLTADFLTAFFVTGRAPVFFLRVRVRVAFFFLDSKLYYFDSC